MMIYHFKKNPRRIQKSFSKRQMKPILFLSKMFTETETRYWSTELKMTTLIWTVRRISHMIKSSKQFTIIYIDHEVNSTIAAETKLNIININKLNLKLIRIFIYFFQFRLNVRHRSKKFNVMSDAFSRLPNKSSTKNENSLDIDAKNSKFDQMYAYVTILIKMSTEFRKMLIDGYVKDSTWKKFKFMLKQLENRLKKKKQTHQRKAKSVSFWKTTLFIKEIRNVSVYRFHAKKLFLN